MIMGKSFQEAYVLIGKESTWGTGVSATKDIGIVQEVDVRANQNFLKSHSLGAREVQFLTPLAFTVAGRLGPIQVQHGRIFEYVFGTVAHLETTGDWTHTFTEGILPSFTLEDGINSTADYVQKFTGCKINTATLSIDTGGVLTVSIDLTAKTIDQNTSAQTKIISTIPPFAYSQVHLKTGADLSEVELAEVQNLEITFGQNLDTDTGKGLGVRTLQQLTERERTYDFRFSMVFNDETEYQRFLGGTGLIGDTTVPTAFSLIVNAHNGVTLGSGRRELYIKFQNCVYNEAGKPVRVGNLIIQDFVGHAKTLASAYMVDNISSGSW